MLYILKFYQTNTHNVVLLSEIEDEIKNEIEDLNSDDIQVH